MLIRIASRSLVPGLQQETLSMLCPGKCLPFLSLVDLYGGLILCYVLDAVMRLLLLCWGMGGNVFLTPAGHEPAGTEIAGVAI